MKNSDKNICEQNTLNAEALTKELIKEIDLYKPSLENAIKELSTLGHSLAALTGKTEQWNNFLATPTPSR